MNFHPVADIFPMMSERDFHSLCADIQENGQREAIWIYEGQIIDGRNRFKACQILGIEPILSNWQGSECELVKFVVSLNLHRRHLNESQRAMVAAKLANIEIGYNQYNGSLNLDTQISLQESADLLNVSRANVANAKKVQQNAIPELTEKINKGEVAVSTASFISELPKDEQFEIVARGEKEILEASKRIRAEKQEVRRQERIEKIVTEAVSPLNQTDKKFAVIYADPPFEYEHAISDSRDLANHYPTMTLDEICALPVRDITTNDAILFMWAMSPKLEEAFRLLNEWGFTYRTCAVWDKEKIGMGYYFRQQHEILLVATKGNIPAPPVESRISSVIRSPRGRHSQKPTEFYDIIEKMYPTLPRIELFARQQKENWEVWGNQSFAIGS